jgi:hypothetical protein
VAVKVTCLLKIEPAHYDTIHSTITGIGFTAYKAPPADQSSKETGATNGRDAMIGIKVFQDRDMSSALGVTAILQEIKGVISVAPLYESFEDPKDEEAKKEVLKNIQQVLDKMGKLEQQIKEMPQQIARKNISWQKKLAPIVISSFITFLTIALAVEHYNALLDPTHETKIESLTWALILGGPTALTFLVQVLFKFFGKDEPHLS